MRDLRAKRPHRFRGSQAGEFGRPADRTFSELITTDKALVRNVESVPNGGLQIESQMMTYIGVPRTLSLENSHLLEVGISEHGAHQSDQGNEIYISVQEIQSVSSISLNAF